MDDQPIALLELSDEELAVRVARREVTAFVALYDRYARPIYAMAAHLLGSAEAEEVVQEVFLRLWRRAGQFDPARGEFGAWFMTVARNYIMDQLRRQGAQRRLRAAEEIGQRLEEIIDPAVDIEDDIWRRERGEAILRGLQSLPPEQRRVIVLSYFGGLSQSPIATHLGWPFGTVKKRMRLGMQKLRAALAQQWPEQDAPTNQYQRDSGTDELQ